MPRKLSKLICVAAIALMSASFLVLEPVTEAQSVPPGTARAWKRNPPKRGRGRRKAAATPEEFNRLAQQQSESRQAASTSANAANMANQKAIEAKAAATIAHQQTVALQADLDAKSAALTIAQAQSDKAQADAIDALAALPESASGQASQPAARSAASAQAVAKAQTAAQAAKAAATAAARAKTAVAEAQTGLQAAQDRENAANQSASDAQTKADQQQATANQDALRVTAAESAISQAVASNTISFAETDQGSVRFSDVIPVTIAPVDHKFTAADYKHLKVDISGPNASDFKAETDCDHVNTNNECHLVVGFKPSANADETADLKLTVNGYTLAPDPGGTLSGSGSNSTNACVSPSAHLAPLNRASGDPRETDPAARALEAKLNVDFDMLIQTIYCFYSQSGAFSLLNGVTTTYTPSASSSTAKGQFFSLAFLGGVQLTAGTTVQTSKSGTGSSSPASTGSLRDAAAATVTAPSLSSTQASQDAQSLVNGGNISVNAVWPAYYVSSSTGKLSNFTSFGLVTARDGFDVPSFLGTTTVTTDVTNHFNLSAESYLQFDALPPQGGHDSAGSVFFDVRYGYNYSAAEFVRQAGFGSKTSTQLGQVTVGAVVVGKVNIAATRYVFAPMQTWTDSTTGLITTKNNLSSWSLSVNFAGSQKSSGSGGQ
jgi:hypothetical protein